MGINMYGYIGPYAEMPQVHQKIVTNKYRCSASDCKNHTQMDTANKFCPLCGAKGEMHSTTKDVITTPEYYRFVEEFDMGEDRLREENGILIPNIGYKGFAWSFDDTEDGQLFDITTVDVESSKEDFKNAYGDIMDKFKENYGVEMKVSFGVLTYIG